MGTAIKDPSITPEEALTMKRATFQAAAAEFVGTFALVFASAGASIIDAARKRLDAYKADYSSALS